MGRKSLRRLVFVSAVSLALLGGACQQKGETSGVASQQLAARGADPVERGKYLVTVTACSDCHTPMKMTLKGPQPDMTRFLSGHPQDVKLPPAPGPAGPWIWHGTGTNTAFAGPWGVTYAINLTPHTHGLSVWTEEMFIKAMRTGKHMGESRPIMPPMPWPSFGQMTDADLRAMFAYLKTIPPVNNVVPDYQLPK
jgi:mono/diheme cytochrome c family protein